MERHGGACRRLALGGRTLSSTHRCRPASALADSGAVRGSSGTKSWHLPYRLVQVRPEAGFAGETGLPGTGLTVGFEHELAPVSEGAIRTTHRFRSRGPARTRWERRSAAASPKIFRTRCALSPDSPRDPPDGETAHPDVWRLCDLDGRIRPAGGPPCMTVFGPDMRGRTTARVSCPGRSAPCGSAGRVMTSGISTSPSRSSRCSRPSDTSRRQPISGF